MNVIPSSESILPSQARATVHAFSSKRDSPGAEGVAPIKEIVIALEWRPHTVEGVMAGALKKELGLTIISEKVDGRGRCYRIVA